MKRLLLALLFTAILVQAAPREKWKTIDVGFRFQIPSDWKKKKVQGIDSHVGHYEGKNGWLEFDEIDSMLRPHPDSFAAHLELERIFNKTPPLRPNAVIWQIDGRLASIDADRVTKQKYGDRKFKNVISAYIPYRERGGYLHFAVFYKSESDLPTAEKIIRSLEWPNKPSPNQARADQRDAAILQALAPKLLVDPGLPVLTNSPTPMRTNLYLFPFAQEFAPHQVISKNPSFLEIASKVTSELTANFLARNGPPGSHLSYCSSFEDISVSSPLKKIDLLLLVRDRNRSYRDQRNQFGERFPDGRAWIKPYLPSYTSDGRFAFIHAYLGIERAGYWKVQSILELAGENHWTICAYRFGKYDSF